MRILPIFGGLLPLVVLGLAIWGVVRLAKGRSDSTDERTDSTTSLRRFFVYVLLYGALIAIVTGALSLAASITDSPDLIATRTSTDVARGLSLLIVGVPVYWGAWTFVNRAFDRDPTEVHSLGWKAYLNAALLTSLIGAMVSLHEVLAGLLGPEAFRTADLADAVIWIATWAAHWFYFLARHPLRSDFHLGIGSAIGLVTVASGLAGMFFAAFDSIYGAALDTGIAGSDVVDTMLEAVPIAVVGGLAWTVYWLMTYANAERTATWHVVVVLVGILGGLITAVVSGATGLHQILQWWFGDPGAANAGEHFAVLPAAAAGLAVGYGTWRYHRAVLFEVASPKRTEQLRIHDYVAASVGLIAAVVGITTIIVALFEAILPSGIAGTEPSNTLVLAITAVLVGSPLWWIFWSRTERLGDDERQSTSRRGYVLGLLGTSAIAAAISLAVLLFDFLEDTFDGLLGADTFRDIRIELALVMTLGAVAWYHFAIWRRDRVDEPAELPARPRQLLLVGPAGVELADALANLGSVTMLRRTDQVSPGDLDVDRLIEDIEGTDAEHVLVIVGDGDPEVIPYRR